MTLSPNLLWQTEFPDRPGLWLRQDSPREMCLMLACHDFPGHGPLLLTYQSDVEKVPQRPVDWWKQVLHAKGKNPKWAWLPEPHGPGIVSKYLPGMWIRDPKDGSWFIDLPQPPDSSCRRRVRALTDGHWAAEWDIHGITGFVPHPDHPDEDWKPHEGVEAAMHAAEAVLGTPSDGSFVWMLPSPQEIEVKEALKAQFDDVWDSMNKLTARMEGVETQVQNTADRIENPHEDDHHHYDLADKAYLDQMLSRVLPTFQTLDTIMDQWRELLEAQETLDLLREDPSTDTTGAELAVKDAYMRLLNNLRSSGFVLGDAVMALRDYQG